MRTPLRIVLEFGFSRSGMDENHGVKRWSKTTYTGCIDACRVPVFHVRRVYSPDAVGSPSLLSCLWRRK